MYSNKSSNAEGNKTCNGLTAQEKVLNNIMFRINFTPMKQIVTNMHNILVQCVALFFEHNRTPDGLTLTKTIEVRKPETVT